MPAHQFWDQSDSPSSIVLLFREVLPAPILPHKKRKESPNINKRKIYLTNNGCLRRNPKTSHRISLQNIQFSYTSIGAVQSPETGSWTTTHSMPCTHDTIWKSRSCICLANSSHRHICLQGPKYLEGKFNPQIYSLQEKPKKKIEVRNTWIY